MTEYQEATDETEAMQNRFAWVLDVAQRARAAVDVNDPEEYTEAVTQLMWRLSDHGRVDPEQTTASALMLLLVTIDDLVSMAAEGSVEKYFRPDNSIQEEP